MARHATITATGLPVYFAHPHSPWERGSNENLNRILREFFPKGVTITFDPNYLATVASEINDRLRKIHNWKTPSELFTELVERMLPLPEPVRRVVGGPIHGLQNGLSPGGLVFNETKIQITNLDEGVDFLSFTIRRFRGKLLTKPSNDVVSDLRNSGEDRS